MQEIKQEVRERLEKFDKELQGLMVKYEAVLYAANQVNETGEVLPVIKIKDVKAPEKVEKVSGKPKK